MKIIDPSEFEDWGYKYVCFQDGTILFTLGGNPNCSHIGIVFENPNLIPVSAGTIKIKGKNWKIIEGGSTSAKLPLGRNDKALLEKRLQPFGYVFDKNCERF